MACRATHQFDEVIVFLCRVAVALNVADNFGVDFGCGVETEGGFNHIVLEVTVDGFGATDNLNACVDALVVFGEHCGVGVGVVTADNNESLNVEFLEDFQTLVELLLGFEFCAA